ncbi:MAG: GNAT superfamily N-acetyltransferase [Myxococcota bacterium]|jgi:GNAT superfamily N-acetyltransferase
MTDTRIRTARPEDVALLPDIERAAAQLFVAAGIGGVVSVMSIADLEIARTAGGLLVAVDDGDVPVGFAVVKTLGVGTHLCEMDVHPNHGRRGLGGALLRACIAWADGRPVTLTTYADLPWNAPFYARHGFVAVPVGDWDDALRRLAVAEGVAPGSGRVVMRLS